jgi:hypothetical protein
MGLKSKVMVVILVVLLLLPGVSHALTDQQKALVGLRGVFVLVADMKPEAERLGLTPAQIKTDVELRLRKAGIRVLAKEECEETPGMPFLYVDLHTAFRQGSYPVTFLIQIKLMEWVTLARGFGIYGAIWSTSGHGGAGVSNAREMRGYVGDTVDQFINDYLAANPKK